jgi:hypothetical protein
MSHNGRLSSASRWSVGRRLVVAVAGVLLYVHGLQPYLPLGGLDAGLAGFAGAFLLAGATYALLADLTFHGEHRRPNAEVLLVGSLFLLLVLLLAAATPAMAGTLSGSALAGLAGVSIVVLLTSAAYLARPDLFRDPP